MLPKQVGNRFRWIGWKSPVKVTIAGTRLIPIESPYAQLLRQGEVVDEPDFVALIRIRSCGPACGQKEAPKNSLFSRTTRSRRLSIFLTRSLGLPRRADLTSLGGRSTLHPAVDVAR